MTKILLLMMLIIGSAGCSSNVELIHSPVGCLNQPNATMGLTTEEFKAMHDSDDSDTRLLQTNGWKKIEIFVKTLRARIDAQCEINKAHDAQYEE